MTRPDYRSLCAELVEAIFEDNRFWEENLMEIGNRARAALAEPEPEGPTDEELFAVAEAYAEDNGLIGLHNAPDFARAVLARWGRPAPLPQPVPVSERLPGHIEQALIKAECALSDIAEGEAEESEGDPLKWAERRAADALARIRLVMRQHHIHTSEWPPLPAHALPLPGEVEAR